MRSAGRQWMARSTPCRMPTLRCRPGNSQQRSLEPLKNQSRTQPASCRSIDGVFIVAATSLRAAEVSSGPQRGVIVEDLGHPQDKQEDSKQPLQAPVALCLDLAAQLLPPLAHPPPQLLRPRRLCTQLPESEWEDTALYATHRVVHCKGQAAAPPDGSWSLDPAAPRQNICARTLAQAASRQCAKNHGRGALPLPC